MTKALAILFCLCGRLSVFAYSANDGAKTITTDGTESDTQSASDYIVGKAQDGWVMTIGSANGRYTWSGAVVFNCTNFNVVSGAGGVIITNATGTNINWKFTCATYPKHTVISNLTWTTDGTGPSTSIASVDGPGMCFRMTGVQFLNTQMSQKFAVKVGTAGSSYMGPYGLIDHCSVLATGGGPAIFNLNDNATNSWLSPMTWGTSNSVVLENITAMCDDNSNQGGGLIDAYNGARWALRYSSISNYTLGTHGPNSGPGVGVLQVEIYSNTFAYPYNGGSFSTVFDDRGGTAAIWGNKIYTFGSNPLGLVWHLWNECAATNTTFGQPFWQYEHCAAQLLYPANYPSFEQIGRGVVGAAEGSVPLYVWNNTTNNATVLYGELAAGVDGADALFIQSGRDFFYNAGAMPGYTPLVYPHPLIGSSTTINWSRGIGSMGIGTR